MTEPPEARNVLRGERRVATVVFSDLAGYTAMNEELDPEDVVAALERVRAMAEQVATAYGGIVNQVVGDEAVLVFGMPVAHDDDASRAVSAALALHEQVDRLGARLQAQLGVALRLHTGINTGLVLFTASDERGGAYAITGDTVNTAARLRSEAAAGEVLVGPGTQRAIAPFFETSALVPLQLKGKAQPLLAHRVLGRSGLHSRFDVARARGLHPHVGRERELARMRARLALVTDAPCSGTAPALRGGASCSGTTPALRGGAAFTSSVTDGALQALAVVADPGMGKSRLLYELRIDAESSGCDLLWGRCEPFGSVPPYQPFLDALRTRLGLQENASLVESAARVASVLGALAPELVPRIPALLEFLSLGSAAPLGPQAAAAALHEQGADAVGALLVALSQRAALVVILEDWHWADEASERLLAHLLSALRAARVLVAISYRPERKPVWEPRLDDLIRLASLAAPETAALARAVLKVEGVSEGLSHLLFERTAGNPLFVEEFCRALGEAGCLVIDDNAARLSATAATTALPDGVQAAIRSRIDRLSAAERRLVALASVIGTQFSASMLELVADVPADVAAILTRLEDAQLVRRQGSGASYAFGHAFIQQVTYDALLKGDRRALHARVAEGLESAFGEGRLAEHYESLARHFGAAGSAEKAAHYSDLAGDKAARAYALQSASDQYRRSIEYLEALPASDAAQRQRVDMTLKWGRASIWRPSLDQMDRLRGSVALARGIGYERGAAWASYWLGWHHYTLGNQVQAISDFEASLQAGTHLREQRLMAQASANLAYCHAAGRNHARAESYLAQMQSLQKSSSLERLWGEIYSLGYRGLIAGDHGEFDRAYELLQAALDATTALNDVAMRGSVLTQIGIVQAQQGAFDALRSTAAELHTIGERVEAAYLLAMSKTFEGYAELHVGQAGRALSALLEAVDALEEMSLMLTMSFNYACLAEGLAKADQPARAERVARQALARGACGDRMGDVMAARALAMAAVRCRVPDVAAAEAHLAVATALAERHGLARECVLARYTRAEVLHAAGDAVRAAEQARALRPELERMHMTHYLARCTEFEAG